MPVSEALVTVVTPTTGDPLVFQAIESVSRQTHKHIQHLVVNDGVELSLDFREKIDRYDIDLIELPYPTGKDRFLGHQIYGASVFLGKGDFFCFLDEDNWFDRGHVASLLKVVDAGFDWAFSLRKIVDADSHFICTDDCESLGKWPSILGEHDFLVDVGCYFLPKALAIQTAPIWYGEFRDPKMPEVDRWLMAALRIDYPNYDTSGLYTLNYRVGNTALSVRKEFFLDGNKQMSQKLGGRLPWRANRAGDGVDQSTDTNAEATKSANAVVELAAIDLILGASSCKFLFRVHTSDENVIAQIFKNGDYNFGRLQRGSELKHYYDMLLGSNRLPLIIDAGANIGASVVYFAHSFPEARIVAIEPESENFKLLFANTQELSVEHIRGALASKPGVTGLVDPGLGHWAFRSSTVGEGECIDQSVMCVTVNEIYATHALRYLPFIVKIDIEGGETDLFSANTEWVSSTPLIIIELHDWMLLRKASSRPFLQCISNHDRDFVYVGENIFSISNNLTVRASYASGLRPAKPTLF
jgi:FkbM family methyltransferase